MAAAVTAAAAAAAMMTIHINTHQQLKDSTQQQLKDSTQQQLKDSSSQHSRNSNSHRLVQRSSRLQKAREEKDEAVLFLLSSSAVDVSIS